MLSVKIESKKESLMFAVALGCVLLLIIGVAWMYWSHSADSVMKDGGRGRTGVVSIEDKQAAVRDENTSLWFFGTLVVALILLFGLTFRYYTHREIKETEEKWKTACQSFLTRMAIEQADYEEEQANGPTVWSKILNGNGVEETDVVGLPDRK